MLESIKFWAKAQHLAQLSRVKCEFFKKNFKKCLV
jgi:hypothetical protein